MKEVKEETSRAGLGGTSLFILPPFGPSMAEVGKSGSIRGPREDLALAS